MTESEFTLIILIQTQKEKIVEYQSILQTFGLLCSSYFAIKNLTQTKLYLQQANSGHQESLSDSINVFLIDEDFVFILRVMSSNLSVESISNRLWPQTDCKTRLRLGAQFQIHKSISTLCYCFTCAWFDNLSCFNCILTYFQHLKVRRRHILLRSDNNFLLVGTLIRG